MVIYLSVGLIDKVVPVLQEAYGASAPCAVVYRASQPEERLVLAPLNRLATAVSKAGIRRQAVIVVGRVLEVRPETLRHKSKLYDAGFSHGFRQGDPKAASTAPDNAER
jgi:precorrin-4/cobalt-precorrin-4 C11-methyltransferase